MSGPVARLTELLVPARLGRSFRWLLAASILTNIGDGIAIPPGRVSSRRRRRTRSSSRWPS